MNKTVRLEIIKTRFAALFGKPLPVVLPVSRREIKSIGEEIQTKFADCMNDSLQSGDEHILRSTLATLAGTAEKETNPFLTAKEKRQLQREVADFKRKQAEKQFRKDAGFGRLLLMA